MYFADGVPDLSVEGVEISPEAIANAIYDIYYDEIDADSELQAELFEQTRRIFADAVAEGVVNAAGEGVSMPDDEFLRAMGDNIEVFSAFRVHRMQKDMVAQMTDGSGRLKPFSKFLNDAFNYADHKNKAWLRTEYNTAVVRAHNAAEWRQFEAEKDVYPNLEWIASTSPNPGRDHSAFWGVVRPVDDPFWNEHRPGDRWNCKCELRATNKRATVVPGRAGKDNDPAPGLEKNPGKKGEVFSDKHPYYPQSCSTCPYSKNKLKALFADLTGRRKCGRCNNLNETINKTEATDIAAELAKLHSLSGAEYNRQLKRICEMNVFKKFSDKIFYTGNTGDPDWKNLVNAAEKAVKDGYTVFILPNPKGSRTPDFILVKKGIYRDYDVKTIAGDSSVGDRLEESVGQARRVLLNFVNTGYKPRPLAKDIKDYFIYNKEALEVFIYKGGRSIQIDRQFTEGKQYAHNFFNLWYKNK